MGAPQKDESVALGRDEYAVYSALIRDLYVRDGRRQVVIANPTCCGAEATAKYGTHFLYQQWAPISQEAFEDFRRRNAARVSLKRSFTLPTAYVFFSFDEIRKFASHPQDSFKDFYAKYPGSGGFITLSRVGFNRKRDEALVYSNMVCGVSCQEGKFIVLAKTNAVWKVRSSVMHTIP